MWFKQCKAYRLPETPDAAVLAEALDEHRFVPPSGLDWFNDGFVEPVVINEMVFSADKTQRIRLKREERVLPNAVINNELRAKVEALETAECRRIGRKEKQELQRKIIDDLLPRAFTSASHTEAVLAGGYLLVNQTGTKAETLLSHLREALGGLQAQQHRVAAHRLRAARPNQCRHRAAGAIGRHCRNRRLPEPLHAAVSADSAPLDGVLLRHRHLPLGYRYAPR